MAIIVLRENVGVPRGRIAYRVRVGGDGIGRKNRMPEVICSEDPVAGMTMDQSLRSELNTLKD